MLNFKIRKTLRITLNRIFCRNDEKDTIFIEIVSILLFEESSVMKDDEIHILFVEYSFLGHRGENMETISVEKVANQEMFYNFRKKFQVDEKTHARERNNLCAMLDESTSPNIKFFVVSEPLPEETTFKECRDVGFATFNIKEYALGDGSKDISLPIKDDRNKQIGILKITVLGFDVIRRCLMNIIRTDQLR